MTGPAAGGDAYKSGGIAYKDKSKPTDIRLSNINAAKGKFSEIMNCHSIFILITNR